MFKLFREEMLAKPVNSRQQFFLSSRNLMAIFLINIMTR